MSGKELLFSVTAKDCRWDYYRGSGKGGQHRNKTDSAVRCTHIASGAVGQCEDHREQRRNKEEAFVRMSKTKKFQDWHKIETARHMGKFANIDQAVDRAMTQIKIEYMKDGDWIDERCEIQDISTV